MDRVEQKLKYWEISEFMNLIEMLSFTKRMTLLDKQCLKLNSPGVFSLKSYYGYLNCGGVKGDDFPARLS